MNDKNIVKLPPVIFGLTAIYILVDPESEEVKYVGASNNPPTRYVQHFIRDNWDEAKLTPKEDWIKKLASKGKYPLMMIVHECVEEDANQWEQHYIEHFINSGHTLFNKTEPNVKQYVPVKKHSGKWIPGIENLKINSSNQNIEPMLKTPVD